MQEACATCLSRDRRLTSVKSLHSITSINIHFIPKDSSICWECSAEVMRWERFCRRAAEAKFPDQFNSLSRLSTQPQADIIFITHSDHTEIDDNNIKTEITDEIHTEFNDIKTEISDDINTEFTPLNEVDIKIENEDINMIEDIDMISHEEIYCLENCRNEIEIRNSVLSINNDHTYVVRNCESDPLNLLSVVKSDNDGFEDSETDLETNYKNKVFYVVEKPRGMSDRKIACSVGSVINNNETIVSTTTQPQITENEKVKKSQRILERNKTKQLNLKQNPNFTSKSVLKKYTSKFEDNIPTISQSTNKDLTLTRSRKQVRLKKSVNVNNHSRHPDPEGSETESAYTDSDMEFDRLEKPIPKSRSNYKERDQGKFSAKKINLVQVQKSRRHSRKSVHFKKPYKCDGCIKGFDTEIEYAGHVDRFHSKMPVTTAEKPRKYREIQENPDKYIEMRKIASERVKNIFRDRISKYAEKEKEEQRLKRREVKRKAKERQYNKNTTKYGSEAVQPRKYRDKQKQENLAKHIEMKKNVSERAKNIYRDKISKYTEKEKEEQRLKWREVKRKAKERQHGSEAVKPKKYIEKLKKENPEKYIEVKKATERPLKCYRGKISKNTKKDKEEQRLWQEDTSERAT